MRWGYSLGKGCEALLDALQRAGGEMGLKELAGALGVTRSRDLRRRNVAQLEAAGVVVYDEVEYTVRLREDWLEALDRERTMNGEKRAANLDRAQHERQREGFRQHLAEKTEKRKGQ